VKPTHLRLHRFPYSLQDGDSRHIFLGSTHRAALSVLMRGIRTGETFVAITGAAGMGKTALVDAALAMLASEAPPGLRPRVIRIDNPEAEPLSLRRMMGQMVGAGDQELSPDELERVLAALTPSERESLLLLVIDNAQALQPDAIRFLLLMQRMRPPDMRQMQVILVGRPELWTELERSDALQVERHIPVRCRLSPLPASEARDFAEYLLSPPDDGGRPLATDPALEAILSATGGIPGRIRAVIERAVAIGAGRNRDWVTLDIAREAIASVVEQPKQASRPERATAVAMLAAAVATGDVTLSASEQVKARRPRRTGRVAALAVLGVVLLGGIGYWRLPEQWSDWLQAETGLDWPTTARAPHPGRPADAASMQQPAAPSPTALEEPKATTEPEPVALTEPANPVPEPPRSSSSGSTPDTPAAEIAKPPADIPAAPSASTPPPPPPAQSPPPAQLSLAAPAPAGGAEAGALHAPAAAPNPAVAPAKTTDILSPSLVSKLLDRGDAMLAAGDISAARLLFRRAAEAGSGRAAIQAGRTYDPRYLNSIGAMGIQADAAEAASWYRRAAGMGSAEATQLLDGLTRATGK
jgi:type II secretory pathway predicted ATPase ExeA